MWYIEDAVFGNPFPRRPHACRQKAGCILAVKTYVTSMPDQAGAFLRASEAIARAGGNIVRVSYNKAVDLHTLFIDVDAPPQKHAEIEAALGRIGYLRHGFAETRVIVVEIVMPDRSGAILPVLEILNRYEINISYMNSSSDGTPFQKFKMGLLIENPPQIRELLGDISRVYPINIVDYDDARPDRTLDNTVFYIRFANEMQKLLDLGPETTMEFISESNRIAQTLQDAGENPDKVFEYVRRFAAFISRHRGENFHAGTTRLPLGGSAALTCIEPPCGSNIYVLESGGTLTLIDTGYAVYAEEMARLLRRLFPAWDTAPKQVCITHADVDHCGLLSLLCGKGAAILLNRKSADSLRRQRAGEPDSREGNNTLGYAYSRLSRIISGYRPPDPACFEIIDSGTPVNHAHLLPIGAFDAGALHFEVLEGSGGHLEGEMVLVCRKQGLIFTGDILVNISGFSPELAQFNSLAPYLMRSVNVDSQKASAMRRETTSLIERLDEENGRPTVVCGGHGPLSVLRGTGKGEILVNLEQTPQTLL